MPGHNDMMYVDETALVLMTLAVVLRPQNWFLSLVFDTSWKYICLMANAKNTKCEQLTYSWVICRSSNYEEEWFIIYVCAAAQ